MLRAASLSQHLSLLLLSGRLTNQAFLIICGRIDARHMSVVRLLTPPEPISGLACMIVMLHDRWVSRKC
jgi:hypothetical protein